MHRVIMNPPVGMEVDHINRNKLDNRRSNLRICTHAENLANRIKPRNNTSGYKGVVWNKSRSKWLAQITVKKRHIYLGQFDDIEEANEAYNLGFVKYYGKLGTEE